MYLYTKYTFSIERGCYSNLESRENRICPCCNSGDVEDEFISFPLKMYIIYMYICKPAREKKLIKKYKTYSILAYCLFYLLNLYNYC